MQAIIEGCAILVKIEVWSIYVSDFGLMSKRENESARVSQAAGFKGGWLRTKGMHRLRATDQDQ